MIMTIAAAAIAAAQPAVRPAGPSPQTRQMQPGQMAPMTPQQHEAMNKECCCKDMMKKMQSGQDAHPMHDHQEHSGH